MKMFFILYVQNKPYEENTEYVQMYLKGLEICMDFSETKKFLLAIKQNSSGKEYLESLFGNEKDNSS